MDSEREKVIYLRIARRAAIDGFTDLSAFASARAEQSRDGNANRNEDDPRASLYSSLSTVTSGTIDEVRAKLKKIDRSKLSQGDRALLDAAQAVAGEVVAPPAPLPAQEPGADTEKAAADKPEDADLPPVEGAMSEQPAVEAAGAATKPAEAPALASASPDVPAAPATAVPPAQGTTPADAKAVAPQSTDAAAVQPASAPASVDGLDPHDPTDAAMIQTRHQLSLIDQMLGAAPK